MRVRGGGRGGGVISSRCAGGQQKCSWAAVTVTGSITVNLQSIISHSDREDINRNLAIKNQL